MTREKPARLLVYPAWDDPRWLQFAFLLAYDVYALCSPGFSRTPAQFAAAILTAGVMSSAPAFFQGGVVLVPVSGLITAFGLLLLCDSTHLWTYVAIAMTGALSKQLFRVEGRHLFNPSNFGLVMGLLFLSDQMTIVGGRWGGSLGVMAPVAALGAFVAWRAKRLDLAAAYAATYVAGAALRSAIDGTPLIGELAPMTGAAFQLFTFNMITDPMATPETRRGRVVFGVLVGALEAALRHYEVRFAAFYALFVLSGFVPYFRSWFPPAAPEQVWRTRVRSAAGA